MKAAYDMDSLATPMATDDDITSDDSDPFVLLEGMCALGPTARMVGVLVPGPAVDTMIAPDIPRFPYYSPVEMMSWRARVVDLYGRWVWSVLLPSIFVFGFNQPSGRCTRHQTTP